MTETLELKAGRELDAVVAEKVFGRMVEWIGGDPFYRFITDGWTGSHRILTYSTDIANAWEVVENMVERGWKVDVQNRYYPSWACHVHFPAPDYRKVFETAEEGGAPFAICLAALKAVQS